MLFQFTVNQLVLLFQRDVTQFDGRFDAVDEPPQLRFLGGVERLQRDRRVGAPQITAGDCQEGFDVFCWHALVPPRAAPHPSFKHECASKVSACRVRWLMPVAFLASWLGVATG